VFVRHLVLVILYGRLSGMQGTTRIPVSHPYRITSTKCRMNTVVSPDDGHIVSRNIQRKERNILRKIVHQVGFIYKIIEGWTVNIKFLLIVPAFQYTDCEVLWQE